MISLVTISLSPIVAHALDELARKVRERFGDRVSEVVLFGSYARGAAHEDSDVDVLVVIDELSPSEEVEVIDLATEVKRAIAESDGWVGLAPLVLSTERAAELRRRGRRIWSDIATEGVRL